MNNQLRNVPVVSKWRCLYRSGGAACILMLAVVPVQIGLYAAWPPPGTAARIFDLFQESALRGLLSMDLLYILNNILLAVIYLALYLSLRRANPSLTATAMLLGFLGIAAYFPSNTAFEMLTLSRGFATAATEAQRGAFLAAGEAMLAVYTGTAFNVYYVLNAAALLLLAYVMYGSEKFGKGAATWGMAAGILMTVPSTAGVVGKAFALASLIPWVVFTALIARTFFRLGRDGSSGEGEGD